MPEAIRKLAEDAELRTALGAAGRERMQNEFSIARMTDRHIRLYESLLDG